MHSIYTRLALSVALLVPLGIAFPFVASADTTSVNFENPPYVVGSISGQDGWSNAVNPAYDQGVVATTTYPSFGAQALRISDAVTSGSFGDWIFAKPLTNAVGETAATDGAFSEGARQTHFEMQFDIASTLPNAQQPGLHVSVSPDRGDGSRMSYLRFEDGASGINVFFDDVTSAGASSTDAFNETQIATNLNRTIPHTVKLTFDAVDGPSNDIVKVYIDGSLVHTGTSWEDYYRYDTEAAAEQSPRIVKTVLFQARGTATPADLGNGFLFDNFSSLSGQAPSTTVKVTIDKFVDGTMATSGSANSTSFPMSATWSATNIGSGTGSFALGPVGFNSPNAYEAVTADMTAGASYTTNENLATTCDAGNPYALVGYTTGATFAAAMAATPAITVPNFARMQSNETVIVWNKTCPVIAPTLKVHVLKYLGGTIATALSAKNYVFPMTATWKTANLSGGVSSTGTYGLGTSFGGAANLYGADTAAMNSPADYTTSEITDNTSQVVASPELCIAGKYVLNGYRTSAISFADAAIQPLTALAPVFTGLAADQYVIVDNSLCPSTASLTIEKDTIGGNGTFKFTGDNGIGAFQITTVAGVGSMTFNNLAPGTYHVTEASTTGWTLTDNAECSSIILGAGASTTCIVTNTKNPKLGEIRGTKYEDRDGDGKLRDGDHHRLSGWTIYLDSNNNGILDGGEQSTVTDAHGNYRFINLPAGAYHVREVGQTGWVETYPAALKYDITLAAGQIAKKKDFGNFNLGSITGQKYNDANGNGRKDVGEAGLAGWTITLAGPNNAASSTVTDANGNYSFTGLIGGIYKLAEVQQIGWHQTAHPGPVKIQSGTHATKDNFGNTQRPLDGDGDYDGSPANGHRGNDNNHGH